MKSKKLLLVFSLIGIFITGSNAQNIKQDTTQAGILYTKAYKTLKNRDFSQLDSLVIWFNTSGALYEKHGRDRELLNTYCGIIECYARQKNETLVLQTLDEIKTLSTKKFGADNPYLASGYFYTGVVYYLLRQVETSVKYYNSALQMRITTLGEYHLETARTYFNLGLAYSDLSDYPKCSESYKKSVEIRKKLLKEPNTDLIWSYYYLAVNQLNAKLYKESLENHFIALSLKQKLYGENTTETANSYNSIGLVYNSIPDYDNAMTYFQKAYQIRQALLGENHTDIFYSCLNIGSVYASRFEHYKALEYFQKAENIAAVLYPENAYERNSLYIFLANSYSQTDENDKSIEYYTKLIRNKSNANPVDEYDLCYWKMQLSKRYRAKEDYSKSMEIADEVIEKLKSINNENSDYGVDAYMIKGDVFYFRKDYKNALTIYNKALDIQTKINTAGSAKLIDIYSAISETYIADNKFSKAEYYNDKIIETCSSCKDCYYNCIGAYNFIASIYRSKQYYDKALEFSQLSLQQILSHLGDKNALLIDVYEDIAIAYSNKNENNLAEEYYSKALNMNLEINGEKDLHSGMLYHNIAIEYRFLRNFEKSVACYQKSIEIYQKSNLDEQEKQIKISQSYMGLGITYEWMHEFSKSTEYYDKCLEIMLKSKVEKDDLANLYTNIGNNFSKAGNNDLALENYDKALKLYSEFHGKQKHGNLANAYNNIGLIYYDMNDFKIALDYFLSAFQANFPSEVNKNKIYETDIKERFFDAQWLETSVSMAAYCYFNLWREEKNKDKAQDYLSEAYKTFVYYDKLTDLFKKNPTKQEDKLKMSAEAYSTYETIIFTCWALYSYTNDANYKEQCFYFSEKNKSNTLLEALSGAQAQKFAGIPDSLLQKEADLKSLIKSTEIKLSAETDSISALALTSELFKLNRDYDALISRFEKDFPNYFQLKYAVKSPSIGDIQSKLGEKTALVSYFSGGTYVFTMILYKNDFQIYEKTYPDLPNLINSHITNIKNGADRNSYPEFQKSGGRLYKLLFPEEIKNGIENLVIIPDGELGLLPFETLLTDTAPRELLSLSDFSELPYLVNKFNISYSYSANLFHATYCDKSPDVEFSDLNDWIAFAPVFSDDKTSGTSLSTRQMMQNDDKTRAFLRNGKYIVPLPGTEMEVNDIFKKFDFKHLKASVQLYDNANENFIKSAELSKYKMIHFATHGFVNSEKPELSGILLMQDTLHGNDGILYSGEIYNLKLNADLVVLSACETGLGKIAKGEGVIGLTRALLYAGSKNIIVSLWQVSDASTKELMINFYDDLLLDYKADKYRISYSKHLQKAKIKLISEKKYAHPFFWSPFILIGK